MTFPDLEALLACFTDRGAERVLCKQLAENDNSKQQIYLGGSFEALNILPFGEVVPEQKSNTFKALLNLWWLDESGAAERAPGAQLILYPRYPEVRLSGFLRGCRSSPKTAMRPVAPGDRRFNNGPDGRLLFIGVRQDKSVLAYLALPDSSIASEFAVGLATGAYPRSGVFRELSTRKSSDSRSDLICRLSRIHRTGWHKGVRLTANGVRVPYTAPNGGGYTLEALFNIRPNGSALPDYNGWELKAFSGSRITLMTPEPDAGYYGEHGLEAFLRKYGRATNEDTLYFTGIHRVNERCQASSMTLNLRGFDPLNNKITDVAGGIDLVHANGLIVATWSFGLLLSHWGRKHALAAYIPFKMREESGLREYRYDSPALLGTGTDFALCLAAMQSKAVVYDPAPKLTGLTSKRTRVKARSQFRVARSALVKLYHAFEAVVL